MEGIVLILWIVMPGNLPDVTMHFEEKTLEECWAHAKLHVDQERSTNFAVMVPAPDGEKRPITAIKVRAACEAPVTPGRPS